MSTTDGPRCAVRHGDQRCENTTTGALPICGPCLTELLDEPDPRRRRALAIVDQLPAGVVQRLVDDPDPQVRAQVATRGDLDAGTIARLADPDREHSPEVWRSLATTPAGAEHAWELCSTNDPLTLAIVASNPLVEADVLERLVHNPDPDVVQAATAARAGQPPDARITAEINDARITEARPITQGPITEQEAVPPPPVATEPELGPDSDAKRRSIVPTLMVGTLILVVIGAVIALAVGLSKGSSKQGLTAGGGAASTTSTSTTTTSTSTTTTTTTPPTTTPPTTTPPVTTPAPTPAPPPTPGTVVIPTTVPHKVTQRFTITSGGTKWCDWVNVTVVFSPAPGQVVVTDGAGRQLGSWSGASGQTKKLTLKGPTSSLNVSVTAVATAINATGRANGNACS